MVFPGSRAPANSAPSRTGVASVAQMLFTSCAIIIVWEVLVRLTTTNSRAPTHISVHWTKGDDNCEPAGKVPEERGPQYSVGNGTTNGLIPAAAIAIPDSLSPESVTTSEAVTPIAYEGQTNASSTWVGRPVKTVAEKRACIRNYFVGGTAPFEQRNFSQWFEDGIIKAMYDCLVPETKYYVEFGVEDGMECTTRNLRENFGWSGLLMDGSYQNDAINLQQEFFTAENVVDHFAKYSVPRHFDHLTLDIDQNTFWVLHSVLLAGFRPRTMVIEVNRNFHPMDSFVVPYDPKQMWDSSNHFGASAGAYTKLLSEFGYQLIAIDQHQINVYAVDSAEVGAGQVISPEEVAAAVQHQPLCASLHTCNAAPAMYVQVPENVSLAQPRQEWYTSLPLWSLRCQGDLTGHNAMGTKMLFAGQQMEAPANATEETILAVEAAVVQPFPYLWGSIPCGTVASVNLAVAAQASPAQPADAPAKPAEAADAALPSDEPAAPAVPEDAAAATAAS